MRKKLLLLFVFVSIMKVSAQISSARTDIMPFLTKLTQLETFPDSTISKIIDEYNSNIKISGLESSETAFKWALSVAKLPQTVYLSYYKEAILDRALSIYHDDLHYYRNKLKVDDNSLEEMRPALVNRSRDIALNEFMYFAYPSIRYMNVGKIRNKYKDKMSAAVMKSNFSALPANLRIVLQNKEELQLSKVQIDSLLKDASDIKRLERKGDISRKKSNKWMYERNSIMKHLTESQVEKFVEFRSSDYIYNKAQKIWAELKSNNLDYKYDSAEVIKNVYHYNMDREKIKYLYRDNSKKQVEMDEYLYKNRYPAELKHLQVEKRRRNGIEKDKDKTKTKNLIL